MVSVSEVFKAWKEGLANKDSSKIGEFFADDFVFIRPTGSVDLRGGTRTRQETLDWTAAGGSPTTIDDNLEVLYENDDVAVICHSANSTLGKDGAVMALYTKKDDKISHLRMVRQEL